MKEWIKVFSRPETDFLKNTAATKKVTLASEICSARILNYIHEQDNYPELEKHLAGIQLSLSLFDSNEIKERILVYLPEKKIYIKSFFYYTLVGRVKKDFTIYLIYFYIHMHNLCPDLTIDIYKDLNTYKKKHAAKLNQDEYDSIFNINNSDKNIHLYALYFLSMINYPSMDKITIMEKKIIRDLIGVSQAKKMLGLDENAYSYIENGHGSSYASETEKQTHQLLKDEFDRAKILFEDYAHNLIKKRRILLWSWWTISPFVSADIARLLPMITEAKPVRMVYLDLCCESQDLFNSYIRGEDIDEDILTKEIQKIYPPMLKSYQKEALPYLVVLEKLKQLSIPIKCFGFNGIELLEREPLLTSNNTLYYPVDKLWQKTFLKEYDYIKNNEGDDLSLFFHFMKPMIVFPSGLNDERVEKIIHTDKFTGFGPHAPQNSLSVFSRYSSATTKSFILPDVANASFNNENIVYFPYKDTNSKVKLEDKHFNKFKLYNTMIYSSFSGGGGSDRDSEVLSPSNSYYQPVG